MQSSYQSVVGERTNGDGDTEYQIKWRGGNDNDTEWFSSDIVQAEYPELVHRFMKDQLIDAATTGLIAVVKRFLAAGVDANMQGEHGQTPLVAAAGRGNTEIVQLLLEKGAGVDVPAAEGRTALIAAAANGHSPTVLALLENGADKEVKDEHKETAFRCAKENGHTKVVEILVQRKRNLVEEEDEYDINEVIRNRQLDL